MPCPSSSRFVRYESAVDAEKAIREMNGRVIQNKILLVRKSNSESSRKHAAPTSVVYLSPVPDYIDEGILIVSCIFLLNYICPVWIMLISIGFLSLTRGSIWKLGHTTWPAM